MGNIYLFKALFTLLSLCTLSSLCSAQVTEVWVRRYDGDRTFDFARTIALDKFGNVYVTGQSQGFISAASRYVTVKYDAAGNELWVRTYESEAFPYNAATAIAVDGNGNVFVTGESRGSENKEDYLTIKYDTDGNELWAKRYNGIISSSDIPQSVAVDPLGNVYVTGNSYGTDGTLDVVTIKYDVNGLEQWTMRYNGGWNSQEEVNDLALDADGNVYVTGSISNEAIFNDYATVKYHTSGGEEWVKTYNGPVPNTSIDVATSLAVDSRKNVYVTGYSVGNLIVENNTETPDYSYTTIKYSQTTITDISCAKKGEKVLVCHKGKTLCISRNAVDAHLRHGDQVGSCHLSSSITSIEEGGVASEQMEATLKRFLVSVAPNPFKSFTRLQFEVPYEGSISIRVYDVVGREVATVVQGNRKAGVYRTELNASHLAEGVYYYKALLIRGQKTIAQTGKLMVVK